MNILFAQGVHTVKMIVLWWKSLRECIMCGASAAQKANRVKNHKLYFLRLMQSENLETFSLESSANDPQKRRAFEDTTECAQC